MENSKANDSGLKAHGKSQKKTQQCNDSCFSFFSALHWYDKIKTNTRIKKNVIFIKTNPKIKPQQQNDKNNDKTTKGPHILTKTTLITKLYQKTVITSSLIDQRFYCHHQGNAMKKNVESENNSVGINITEMHFSFYLLSGLLSCFFSFLFAVFFPDLKSTSPFQLTRDIESYTISKGRLRGLPFHCYRKFSNVQ